MADRTSQPTTQVGVNPLYSNPIFLWNGAVPGVNSLNGAAPLNSVKGTNKTGLSGKYQHFNNVDGAMEFAATLPTGPYTLITLVTYPVASIGQAQLVATPAGGGGFRLEMYTTGGGAYSIYTHTSAAAATAVSDSAPFDTNVWVEIQAYDGTKLHQYRKTGAGVVHTIADTTMGYVNPTGAQKILLGDQNNQAGQGAYAVLLVSGYIDATECANIVANPWKIFAPVIGPVTGVTLTGPATGTTAAASTNFTVGVTPVGGDITGTVVVTPSDAGAGGTFAPTSVSLVAGSPTATFTYTAATSGAKTITVANNGSLANPSAVTYTASAAAATAIVVNGPTSGTVNLASTNFTVSANGSITGTVVVTPSATGCTFSPSTVSISAGSPTATFTCTPTSTGAKTISFANNGSLTNQGNLTYTASLASATAVTLSGPTAGTVGAASSIFSVGANGAITGTIVVTPSDASGGGSFSPTSVSLTSGSPTATFTYTPGSAGAKAISVTNNGSLTNPSSVTYTATSSTVTTTITSPGSGKFPSTGALRVSVPCNVTALDKVTHAVLERKTGLTSTNGGGVVFTSTVLAAGVERLFLVKADADDKDLGAFFATPV